MEPLKYSKLIIKIDELNLLLYKLEKLILLLLKKKIIKILLNSLKKEN
jgi:hypothetical protein